MDTWIDKVLKIVVALGYMLAIILALFLFIIALWVIGGWVWW
jgi:hypothetical protein